MVAVEAGHTDHARLVSELDEHPVGERARVALVEVAGDAALYFDAKNALSIADVIQRVWHLPAGIDDLASDKYWVTFIGVIFLVVVTWICYKGIELSARTQFFLLGIEMAVLALACPLHRAMRRLPRRRRQPVELVGEDRDRAGEQQCRAEQVRQQH